MLSTRPCVGRPSSRAILRRSYIGRHTTHLCKAVDGPDPHPEQPAPQTESPQPREATTGNQLSRSLSELSKGSKRLNGSTNLLLSGESLDTWRRLDSKVNKYPMQRSFTAVGTGGQEFRQAMVAAVERVVGSVHEECVSERHSSQRKYISVTVGPVWIQNGDQIIAVYANMKEDGRAKYII